MLSSVRRGVAALALAALVSSTPPALAATEHPAQTLVVDSTTEMLAVLKNESERIAEDPVYLDEKVDEIIVPHLDFDTMTKLVVGKFWRDATPEQRTALVEEFRTFLLGTYTEAMTEYSGGTISFVPFRPQSREDRAVVRSVFEQSGSPPIEVNYKLRERDGWKIYEIEADGVDLVMSQRPAFAREIREGGIDGLLETLREKNGSSG